MDGGLGRIRDKGGGVGNGTRSRRTREIHEGDELVGCMKEMKGSWVCTGKGSLKIMW